MSENSNRGLILLKNFMCRPDILQYLDYNLSPCLDEEIGSHDTFQVVDFYAFYYKVGC